VEPRPCIALTRRVRTALVGAAAAAALGGCTREPTRWEVDVVLPLVEDTLAWDDIIADTGAELAPGEEGAVLRWKGTLGEVVPDGLATLPDTVVHYAFSPEFVGGPFPVPPGVTLFDQTEDIAFAGIDAALRSAVLSAGSLRWTVESTVDGAVAMDYALPGVTTASGTSIALHSVLEPGVGEERAVATGVVDLAGAVVDFTGESGLDVNRLGSILTVGTPADILDTAAILGVDSVRIELEFSGVQVREVVGYFGSRVEEWQFAADLVDVARFPAGFVDFSAAQARLLFTNRLGADLRLEVDALRVDYTPLLLPVIGVPVLLARADWSGPLPVPTTLEVDLLRSRPQLAGVLGGLPARVVGSGRVALNPLGDVTGGNDYLHVDYLPTFELELEVPLRIGLEGVVFRDTLEFGGVDLPDFVGELVVECASTFPVELDLTGLWLDPSMVEFGGSLPAFDSSSGLPFASGTFRVPISSTALIAPGRIAIEATVATAGRVVLTGTETVRIRVRVEGEVGVGGG
jgi:hypothetical protein